MTVDGRKEKPVTIKDIAKIADVSYATVSRALSGNPAVKEKTRRLILDICEREGYTANDVARSMVMKKTNLLGVILPSIDNPFMSELAYHIECIAREQNYNIILCNSSGNIKIEEQVFMLLLGRQVDGILLLPSCKGSYDNLKKYFNKVPTVFVNENLEDVPESYVVVDNYRGTCMATEYLLSLGHRNILYFGRSLTTSTHTLRAKGYQDTCEKNGIAPLFWDNVSDITSIETGYEMAKELFAAKKDYSAIVAGTDTLALGVIKAADERGLFIPQDISLIGFDNIRYTELPKINLTTIEQPKAMMAEVAVTMLINKIQSDYRGYTHRILTPTLIKRNTCIPEKGYRQQLKSGAAQRRR